MTVDKVRRVRSVRKWLEKAESSFTSHKDISGELNLIMAQAEMQRLKETDKAGERRRTWGLRVAAFAVAAVLLSGASLFFEAPSTAEPAAPIMASSALPREEKKETQTIAPAVETAPAEVKENPAAETTSMATDNVTVTEPSTSAAPVPAPAAAAELPVLTQQEIQSVVGEAGRALRGQD